MEGSNSTSSPSSAAHEADQAVISSGNDENAPNSDTPGNTIPPLSVLLVTNSSINPSPITMLQTRSEVTSESPLVNAFKAQYDKTDDGGLHQRTSCSHSDSSNH